MALAVRFCFWLGHPVRLRPFAGLFLDPRRRVIRDHSWGPCVSVLLHVLIIVLLARAVQQRSGARFSTVEVMLIQQEDLELDAHGPEDDPEAPPEEEADRPDDIPAVAPPAENLAEILDALSPSEDAAEIAPLFIHESPQALPAGAALAQLRSPAGRAAALQMYAGRDSALTEASVARALEWLAAHQNEDGSWGEERKVGMTGLALLTFLAHGETTSSERYGTAVRRAITFLADRQTGNGKFGTDNAYEHAIATFAVCEAYTLTHQTAVRPVIVKAVGVIIRGQQTRGGWDYEYKKGVRRDTSVVAWQVQALKAASIAGLREECIPEAMRRAARDLRDVRHSSGRFGYTQASDGSIGTTGMGVLALQLLGHADSYPVRQGLAVLMAADVNWRKKEPFALYRWYYITQAKFHAGGEEWARWNELFAAAYLENQNADGSWSAPGGGIFGDDNTEDAYGAVYTTTMAALTLQVYHRHLPSHESPTGDRIARSY